MKLQKQAIRTINEVTRLFIESSVYRFHDIVYLGTLEVTHRVVNKDIPVVIEGMFKLREGHHDSRGSLMFFKYSRIECEAQMCVSAGSETMERTQTVQFSVEI